MTKISQHASIESKKLNGQQLFFLKLNNLKSNGEYTENLREKPRNVCTEYKSHIDEVEMSFTPRCQNT